MIYIHFGNHAVSVCSNCLRTPWKSAVPYRAWDKEAYKATRIDVVVNGCQCERQGSIVLVTPANPVIWAAVCEAWYKDCGYMPAVSSHES